MWALPLKVEESSQWPFRHLYHLESRWHNSHVIIGPLLSHLLGADPSTFMTFTTVYISNGPTHTLEPPNRVQGIVDAFLYLLPCNSAISSWFVATFYDALGPGFFRITLLAAKTDQHVRTSWQHSCSRLRNCDEIWHLKMSFLHSHRPTWNSTAHLQTQWVEQIGVG